RSLRSHTDRDRPLAVVHADWWDKGKLAAPLEPAGHSAAHRRPRSSPTDRTSAVLLETAAKRRSKPIDDRGLTPSCAIPGPRREKLDAHRDRATWRSRFAANCSCRSFVVLRVAQTATRAAPKPPTASGSRCRL